MIIGIIYLKYTLIPHTRFQHDHSGVHSFLRHSSIHSFWDCNIPQWLFKTNENIKMLKLAWQFGFEYSHSGSNIFINRESINKKHCSAEKVSRELLSITSRDNTEKPQASSQRNKKEEKTLLHSCLHLVSFPFLLDTQPAPAHEPCQRYSCGTSQKMVTKLGEFSFSTLSSCTTPFSVCWRETGNKLKAYLKEDQYIWQPEQTHVFSNILPMQKIRLDFLLGISH